MSTAASTLSLRSFLAELEAADPTSILRIPDRVALDFDVTAVAMELEHQGRSPALPERNPRQRPGASQRPPAATPRPRRLPRPQRPGARHSAA
jgi:hypothetical protein